MALWGAIPAATAQALPEQPGPEATSADITVDFLARQSSEDALRIIAGLGDADMRLLLLEEVEHARERLASDATEHAGLAVLMVQLRNAFATQAALIGERLALVGTGLAMTPGEVAKIMGGLGGDHGAAGGLWVVAVMVLALGAGWLAQRLAARAVAPLRLQIERVEGSTLDRLGRGFLRFSLEVGGWLAFAAVAFGLKAILLAENPTGRAFVAGYATAALFILVAMGLCRFVLAPRVTGLRVLGLSDSLARFLDAWIVRLVAVSGIAWLTAAFLILNGQPPLAVHLTLVLMSGAAVLATVVAAIWAGHRAFPIATPAPGASSLAQMVGRNWHWLATAYVLFVALLWAGGILTTGRTVLWPAMASLLIVALLPVIDRAAKRAIIAVVDGLLVDRYATAGVSMGGEDAGPARTAPVDTTAAAERYVSIIHRVARFLFAILAGLALLRLWGFDPLAQSGAPGADRIWAATFNIAVTIGLAFVVWQLAEAAMTRQRPRTVSTTAAQWDGGTLDEPSEIVELTAADDAVDARARTLLPLIRKFILAVLAVMVVMITLSSVGVDIGPLLAGAGVVGLALGFGAQSLVRDVVSGIFFLIDDAFRIGEYIEMEEIRGEVEAITPRSLRLRHHRGAVHTIPFGELRYITNYNRDWVIYKMNMRVAGDTDPHLVKKIIKTIGNEMLEDPELGSKFLEPLKSQGVFRIDDDSALVIRVKFMSKPREQFVLRREAFHRIQKAFVAHGITFAKRNVEVNVRQPGTVDDAAAAGAAAVLEQQRDGRARDNA